MLKYTDTGNNVEAEQIIRVTIPFFSETTGTAQPGTKYFFPDNPHIDNKTIVGIEAHASTGIGAEDLSPPGVNLIGVPPFDLTYIYFTFMNENDESIFENVPALFLFGKVVIGNLKRKFSIMPFLGKIKTKKCFAYIPANTPLALTQTHLQLTFYLR
jgi:hypothetical protein